MREGQRDGGAKTKLYTIFFSRPIFLVLNQQRLIFVDIQQLLVVGCGGCLFSSVGGLVVEKGVLFIGEWKEGFVSGENKKKKKIQQGIYSFVNFLAFVLFVQLVALFKAYH
eukprot:TRINITY_DN9285_c0_g1_i14.p1 TRINITY_DN9285_c0_g1~~TRINITY_DN9285_c0_g1_i14.p1  ORF type:complete len:111 (+),score=16.34 TRINITY_DN9285_c0_g1_i14:304-636(+)